MVELNSVAVLVLQNVAKTIFFGGSQKGEGSNTKNYQHLVTAKENHYEFPPVLNCERKIIAI